ncbi:MAG: energy transducer TonB [Spirochaetes bacterium]|nr:energy transducer TonB [Spirochaetota bacterium]
MKKFSHNKLFIFALCISIGFHSAILFASLVHIDSTTHRERIRVTLRTYQMLPRVEISSDMTQIKNNPMQNDQRGAIATSPYAISYHDNKNTMLSYTDMIRQQIQSAITYPHYARKNGIEGRPVVRFTINENGELTMLELVYSSGFSILDEEALATIRRAAPFPKIPTQLQKESITCIQGLEFTLK